MKTLRVAICIVLIVCVLSMSLSVFAVDPTPTPSIPPLDEGTNVINEELLSRYIWLCLNAWGIHIKYENMDTFYDEIEAQIITWVIEYLASLPSAYSINQWIAPWQASYDYWGNLQLNSSALEDISEFADWLITKFGLTDDEIQIINPTFSVNGYTLYSMDTYYNCMYQDGTEDSTYVAISLQETVNNTSNPLGYYISVNTSTGLQRGSAELNIVFRDTTGNKNLKVDYINSNGNSSSSGTVTGTYYYPANSQGYSITSASGYFKYNSTHGNLLPEGTWFIGTTSEISHFKEDLYIVEEGSLRFVTNTLELPIQNPDYTNGDGITIIDGKPNYEVITFSGEITNLPAIITQQSIPDIGNDENNPGFSVPWQAINGLIQYVAAPAGAIMALINEAPVEGVIMLYALLGGIIIFGMIRIMREH